MLFRSSIKFDCIFVQKQRCVLIKDMVTNNSTGHVNIGIIFYCIGNSQLCIYKTQSKSDWLFNTKSRELQADWWILENIDKKATLNINKHC